MGLREESSKSLAKIDQLQFKISSKIEKLNGSTELCLESGNEWLENLKNEYEGIENILEPQVSVDSTMLNEGAKIIVQELKIKSQGLNAASYKLQSPVIASDGDNFKVQIVGESDRCFNPFTLKMLSFRVESDPFTENVSVWSKVERGQASLVMPNLLLLKSKIQKDTKTVISVKLMESNISGSPIEIDLKECELSNMKENNLLSKMSERLDKHYDHQENMQFHLFI